MIFFDSGLFCWNRIFRMRSACFTPKTFVWSKQNFSLKPSGWLNNSVRIKPARFAPKISSSIENFCLNRKNQFESKSFFPPNHPLRSLLPAIILQPLLNPNNPSCFSSSSIVSVTSHYLAAIFESRPLPCSSSSSIIPATSYDLPAIFGSGPLPCSSSS